MKNLHVDYQQFLIYVGVMLLLLAGLFLLRRRK